MILQLPERSAVPKPYPATQIATRHSRVEVTELVLRRSRLCISRRQYSACMPCELWEQYGAVEAARSREPRAAIDDFADSGSRGEMNASRPENPETAPPVLDSSRPRDLKRGIGLWRWKKSRYG